MPNFLGTFPFCVEERDPIEATQEALGTSAFNGSLYPIGMTLRHAMLLYWRLKQINLSWSVTSINGESFYNWTTIDGEHTNEYTENYNDFFETRVCEETNSLFAEIFYSGGETEYVSTIDLFGGISGAILWNPLFDFIPEDLLKCVKYEDLYYPYINFGFFGYSVQFGTVRIFSDQFTSAGTSTINLNIEETDYPITIYQERSFTEASVSFSCSDAICVLHEP
jgi:hypothetical protein